MGKIKVFIADDSEEIINYFCMIIQKEPDMEIAGTAKNGKQSIIDVIKMKPDIVLMDIQMETMIAGIEAIEEIKKEASNIKVIVLTIHERDEYILRAYAAGASDYIIKTSSVADILNSIRNVYFNKYMLRPEIANKIIKEYMRIKEEQSIIKSTLKIMTKLTNTEYEILKLIYQGYSYKEIAEKRFVEETTIRSQIYWILKKFEKNKMKEVIKLMKELKIFEIYDLS
jgi:DNA-binding NarL/FixJ family response regulator